MIENEWKKTLFYITFTKNITGIKQSKKAHIFVKVSEEKNQKLFYRSYIKVFLNELFRV